VLLTVCLLLLCLVGLLVGLGIPNVIIRLVMPSSVEEGIQTVPHLEKMENLKAQLQIQLGRSVPSTFVKKALLTYVASTLGD
jgi:uncharacterized membrane-anchored protein YhcB (DUF1043 family)